jgi:molybdopterin-guanine dinucleotide biosynthesis protein A
MPGAAFDALILAGVGAVRLGGVDKPALLVGTRTLLQRVLDAVEDARRVVIVGPPRPGLGRTADRALMWRQEQPPGGGPVAALAAGLSATDADVVLLLAADLPWIGAAVPELVSALATAPTVAAAVLTDAGGRRNHLAAAWRRHALTGALARIGSPAGAPARALYADVAVVEVDDPGGAAEDCDTWPDVARARARAERELR